MKPLPFLLFSISITFYFVEAKKEEHVKEGPHATPAGPPPAASPLDFLLCCVNVSGCFPITFLSRSPTHEIIILLFSSPLPQSSAWSCQASRTRAQTRAQSGGDPCPCPCSRPQAINLICVGVRTC